MKPIPQNRLLKKGIRELSVSIYTKFKLIIMSLAGLSHTAFSCDQTIEKVVLKTFIENPPYTIDIEISDKTQLSNIQLAWCKFQKTDKYPPIEDDRVKWTHSITIIGGGKLDGIWLYMPSGFLARLNNRLNPRYLINDPEQFNRLLGLAEKDSNN